MTCNFKSAGICLWNIINDEICILLIEEYRHNKMAFNFVGGKKHINELPHHTAMREMKEETSLIIPLDDAFSLYIKESKYTLYIKFWNISHLPLSCLCWVPINSIIYDNIHTFARGMVKSAIDYLEGGIGFANSPL